MKTFLKFFDGLNPIGNWRVFMLKNYIYFQEKLFVV